MVQIKFLSGKKAGSSWETRRFPVRIGRSARSDLRVEEAGVWDDHLKLSLAAAEGFLLETQTNALASVNGEPKRHVALRNGDVIEIGSIKLQFWMSEAPQRGLRMREAFVWVIIAAVCLTQIGLVYWLLKME